MSVNRYHGTLNGVQFRILQGDGYRRFFSRQVVEEQVNSGGAGLTSRRDQRRFLQTNWSDGSTWFRPMLTPETSGTYQYGRGMDHTRHPGAIVPHNLPMSENKGMADESPIFTAPPLAGGGATTVYGQAATATGTGYPLRYWNATSIAWVNSTGEPLVLGDWWQATYDQVDDLFYAFNSTKLGYTNGTTSTGRDAITITPSPGASLLAPIQGTGGYIQFYDGDILYRLNDAKTALVAVTDDGLGRDILESIGTSATQVSPRKIRLAVSTAEGVYYCKNVWAPSGGPQAWLFRVERDAAGNIISVPIATLPTGSLALSIGYAYGNPIVLTTTEWSVALNNDSREYSTELWSVVGGTLGLLGSFNTKDPESFGNARVVDTVGTIIGVLDGKVAIGSKYGIWTYDPVRGGVHFEHETFPDIQEYAAAYLSNRNNIIFENTYLYDWRSLTDLLNTDADTYTHRTFSNWLDFGLPGEDKTIVKVRTQLADYNLSADHSWVVTITDENGTEYGDDSGTYTHEHVASVVDHESTWSLTSERFRYSINFQCQTNGINTDPAPLISIQITAETGEMIEGWQLTIDGTQFVNVEGAPQHPLAVFDAWVALAQNSAILSFTDNYEALEASESTTYNVKIQSVGINKENPNESMVEVVLIRV